MDVIKFFTENDKHGNKKKFSYLKKYYPNVLFLIDDFCQKNNHVDKTFKEKLVLFLQNYAEVNNVKCEKYERWIYRFVKREEKVTYRNLSSLYREMKKINGFDEQISGGKITQLIMKESQLLDEMNSLYDAVNNLINNTTKEKFRCKVYMWFNDIKTIPTCKLCNKPAKFGNSRGFLETCSEECRRTQTNISSFRNKLYVLPSGKVANIQGYENFVLDEIFKTYKESDVIVGNSEIFDAIGVIFYEFEGSNHRYFPDIYIKSENKIIEVKSSYTYDVQREQNDCKKNACLGRGLNFCFWVWDTKKIEEYTYGK